MSHVAIEEVVRRIHDLPSLPAVVAELLSSMDDDVDLHALAGKIALDQALTAKTLRLANSSFYGMQSKVTSIQQAMSVLGFHSIRTLVTACGVIGGVPRSPGVTLDFDAFWRHSIATAVYARALARHLKQSPDTAFTAGLLHDLGTLVLATRFPDEYAGVDAWRQAHGGTVAEAQMAVFGVDHGQAGGALAAYWKFPPAIQESIGHHDSPGGSPLVRAVYVADILTEPEHDDDQRDQAWTMLGIDDEQRGDIAAHCDLMYRDMCQILVS